MSNAGGSKYNTGPDDLVSRLAALENRIATLERVPSLSNASIDSGGLNVKQGAIRVYDNLDQIRIAIGKLDDGNYDLAAYSSDGLSTVNLAQLAFGQHAAFDTTNCTVAVNSAFYGDPNTGTIGPSVTNVLIGTSGRAKVTISGHFDYLTAASNDGQLFMSCQIDGATHVSASDDTALQEYYSAGGAAHRTISFSRTHLFTGLNPGIHTFTIKYAAEVTVGSSLTHGFSDREIFVEPF